MIIAKSHMKRIVKEEISKILEAAYYGLQVEWWSYDPEFIRGAEYDETSLQRDAWDKEMWATEFISSRNPHHNRQEAWTVLKDVLARGRKGKLTVKEAYNELTRELQDEYVQKYGLGPMPEDEDEDEDGWDDDEDTYDEY